MTYILNIPSILKYKSQTIRTKQDRTWFKLLSNKITIECGTIITKSIMQSLYDHIK